MKTQPAHIRLFTLVLLVSSASGPPLRTTPPPQAYSAVAIKKAEAWAAKQSRLISASPSSQPMNKCKILRNW